MELGHSSFPVVNDASGVSPQRGTEPVRDRVLCVRPSRVKTRYQHWLAGARSPMLCAQQRCGKLSREQVLGRGNSGCTNGWSKGFTVRVGGGYCVADCADASCMYKSVRGRLSRTFSAWAFTPQVSGHCARHGARACELVLLLERTQTGTRQRRYRLARLRSWRQLHHARISPR
jgi:hypothetical protein